MTTYVDMGEINAVYPRMIGAVMTQGKVVVPRGERTREMHPALMVIENPRRRLVTSYGRPVNVAFALAEVMWILQGRGDVKMLKHYNGNIENYSDNGETFNAAYGARMRWAFGHDQLEDVIATLTADPDTRQATIVLSLPEKDKGWDYPGTPHVTKDRACNVLAHVMIRDGALDWYQVIRSNDALWGTPYNWMQWTHIQEYMAGRLGIPMGKFIHNVDSLHIYERQWDETPSIKHFDLYGYFGLDHDEMDTSPEVLRIVFAYEKDLRLRGARETELPDADVIGMYWYSVCRILLSHWWYKEGDNMTALSLLDSSDGGVDPVYGAAVMRFYWHHRWYKNPDSEMISLMEDWMETPLMHWITASHA